MKPEIRAMWTAALRSGAYQQGISRLRSGDNYCCLGVLCDLAVQAGIGRWRHTLDDFDAKGELVSTALPWAVVDWAGLSYSNPGVGVATLAEYNDGAPDTGIRPHSFAEIADLIDAWL